MSFANQVVLQTYYVFVNGRISSRSHAHYSPAYSLRDLLKRGAAKLIVKLSLRTLRLTILRMHLFVLHVIR